jgi:2-methylcitrate dehydratase PrpD
VASTAYSGSECPAVPAAAGDASTLAGQLSAWGSALTLEEVPERVRAIARSLVLSQLAAARATLAHDLGPKVLAAFGSPLQQDPKQAACSLAALTIALDFDDTVFAGHVTHSSLNVSLAYASHSRRTGAAMLTATLAAIECAARVTAAVTLGPHRGQAAAHSHLVGGVAARLHSEQAPPALWLDALGLALSAPPWPVVRGFIASDAKLLIAATPLRAGLDACDAARAGLRGAADILEHPEGFLAAVSDVPLPELCVAALGQRWHTETAAFKVHPGSAYIASAVDCAIELHEKLGAIGPDDVEEIVVRASIFTTELERLTSGYLDGPATSPITLGFSATYGVATALLTGNMTPAEFSGERIRDECRWRLMRKVHLEHDLALSLRALACTAPIGEALRHAADQAVPWLEAQAGTAAGVLGAAFGEPVETFEAADKALGASVTARLTDGTEMTVSREIARGATGPETRTEHFSLMSEKFLATGGEPDVVNGVAQLESLSAGELHQLLSVALA